MTRCKTVVWDLAARMLAMLPHAAGNPPSFSESDLNTQEQREYRQDRLSRDDNEEPAWAGTRESLDNLRW